MAPLYIAAVLTFGLFVGSFFSRREHAFQFITGASLMLFFLANLSWPLSSTPPLLAVLAKLLPTTPGVNAMAQINQMGGDAGRSPAADSQFACTGSALCGADGVAVSPQRRW